MSLYWSWQSTRYPQDFFILLGRDVRQLFAAPVQTMKNIQNLVPREYGPIPPPAATPGSSWVGR